MVPGVPLEPPKPPPNFHPDLRQTTFSYRADFFVCLQLLQLFSPIGSFLAG